MDYYALLRSFIADSGLSLKEISERLEEHGYKVSKGYISQLQNGKTGNPATDELNRALASVTGGDVEKLLTAAILEKAPVEIKQKFERLLQLKKLRSEYQTALSNCKKTEGVSEQQSLYDASTDLMRVPLLGSIAAGQPIDRIEYIENIEYVNKSVVRNHESFALNVKGDSMIGDNIIDGDIVICIKQSEVSTNDIAVVALDGETATIKRVKCQGELCILMPSNPKMQPIIVDSKRVEIIGKVVEVRRRF